MGCKGCGGEFVKGSLPLPASDTFEGAITRAVAKVRSGRVSAVHLTSKGRTARIWPETDNTDAVWVRITEPDGLTCVDKRYTIWRDGI